MAVKVNWINSLILIQLTFIVILTILLVAFCQTHAIFCIIVNVFITFILTVFVCMHIPKLVQEIVTVKISTKNILILQAIILETVHYVFFVIHKTSI